MPTGRCQRWLEDTRSQRESLCKGERGGGGIQSFGHEEGSSSIETGGEEDHTGTDEVCELRAGTWVRLPSGFHFLWDTGGVASYKEYKVRWKRGEQLLLGMREAWGGRQGAATTE